MVHCTRVRFTEKENELKERRLVGCSTLSSLGSSLTKPSDARWAERKKEGG